MLCQCKGCGQKNSTSFFPVCVKISSEKMQISAKTQDQIEP